MINNLGCYNRDSKRIYVGELYSEKISEGSDEIDLMAERKVTALHSFLLATYDQLDKKSALKMCDDVVSVVEELTNASIATVHEVDSEDDECRGKFAWIGSKRASRLGRFYESGSSSDDVRQSEGRLLAIYREYFAINDELDNVHWNNESARAHVVLVIQAIRNNKIDDGSIRANYKDEQSECDAFWRYLDMANSIDSIIGEKNFSDWLNKSSKLDFSIQQKCIEMKLRSSNH
jgi:hypothetical protein